MKEGVLQIGLRVPEASSFAKISSGKVKLER
jgi:hypothetical protein